MTLRIDQISKAAIPLGDGYRYVGSKEYQARDGDRECADDDLIATLLSHPTFRDSYDTPTSEATDRDVHGPYVATGLSVNEYRSVPIDNAVGHILAFVDDPEYKSPDISAREQVNSLLERLRTQGWSAYRLEPRADQPQHELFFIHQYFQECIFTKAKEGRVVLVTYLMD